MSIALLATTLFNVVLSHSHMSESELARHRFDNVYMPFLLRNKGLEDTQQNRNRLMRELINNTSTDASRRHLDTDKVPEGVYMSPGCSCKEVCYAGTCPVADRTTCSFTETFDGSYFATWCKANGDLSDYQGTSGFKFSTKWMDCLRWNIVPCYSPEISVFYTKALQQGVYADAQSLQAFPNVGTPIPNNVDKKRNFSESGTNTPEALADVLPEGGKIRTPRRKVLTLDVRVTYVLAGDDYKAYLGQDADAAWCINEKNGASWDKDYGECVCLGENDCEVVVNDDGVTQQNGCSQYPGESDWFGKDACKGHCRCKPKPTPEQTMATAKTTIESYTKDMHKAFGDHLQFKLSGWRTLDISNKTGTPPSGDVRVKILEKGMTSLDYKALEWIMKQAKDINIDITKAPYRNPSIEVLVVPKASDDTAGEAFGDHQQEHDPNSLPMGVATILLNYQTVQSDDYRETFYHEMGHILGLFHTFEGNQKTRLETKPDSSKIFLGNGESQCLQCPVCTASPNSWFNGDFIADTKAAGTSQGNQEMVKPSNSYDIYGGQCNAEFRKDPGGELGSGYCRPQYGMDADPQNPGKYVVGVGSETNLMAYGTPSCQTELTLGQEARAVCFTEMNWQHVMPSMAGQKGQTRAQGTEVTSPQPPSPVFVTLSRDPHKDCQHGKTAVSVEWLPPISDMRCREDITVGGEVVKGECAGKYTVWQKRSGTADWSVVKTVFVPDFGKTKIENAESTLKYSSPALPINSSYHFKVVASSWIDHSEGPTSLNGKRGYWNDGPAVEAFAPGNGTCGATTFPASCPSCVTPATYSSALGKGPAYPGCGAGDGVEGVLDEEAALTKMYTIGTLSSSPSNSGTSTKTASTAANKTTTTSVAPTASTDSSTSSTTTTTATTTTTTTIAATTTTTATTTVTTGSTKPAAKSMWTQVGVHSECDGSAGEVYLESSPGKVPDIEKCKDTCESDPRCKSISFLKSRWCSHFSTPCTKTKRRGRAIAMRLTRGASTKPESVNRTPSPKRYWKPVKSNTACDTTKGELFMATSRKRISSLEQCKKLCELATGCQSITYYKGGYCGHYSTSCTQLRYVKKAVGTFTLVSSQTMLRRV